MAKKIFRSFDSFISEMQHETVSFEMFGKTYEFEKRMPALVPLELAKYDTDAVIPRAVLNRAALQIFGEKTLSDLCAHPAFTIDVLDELIRWAFQVINGIGETESIEVTEDDVAVSERKN